MEDTTLKGYQETIAETNFEKGWRGPWSPEHTFGDLIALLHSEASEALEEFRNGHKPIETYYKHDKNCISSSLGLPDPSGNLCCVPEPHGVPIELADILIRVLDVVDRYGIDINKAMFTKIGYNKTRPFRHGKKVI